MCDAGVLQCGKTKLFGRFGEPLTLMVLAEPVLGCLLC